MKNIKVISLILFGLFSAGCNSISEPPVSAQVFAVLTTVNVTSQVSRDTSITVVPVDAAASADGRGGVTVSGTSGGAVTFEASDLALMPNNAYVLKKPVDANGIEQKLVLGGARNNFKYGDYGYWMETDTKANKVSNWAPFVMFSADNMSVNIPKNDGTTYAYSGRVLGGLDLYYDDINDAAPEVFVETAEVTGNITLTANFLNNSLSGAMSLNVNNTPWYNATISSTGGAQADGSFTGTITLDNSYSGKFALTSGVKGGYVTTFGGQFLGPDGKIPAEALGQFSIISNPGSVNNFNGTGKGYRPEVYGSFGVKK